MMTHVSEMSTVFLRLSWGVFHLLTTAAALNGRDFTYTYLSPDSSVLELECRTHLSYPEHDILMISIHNTSNSRRLAQVLRHQCPTVEESLNSQHLYLPGCVPSSDQPVTSLKLLITNYDSSKVQTFLCNFTKLEVDNQVSSTRWAITVDKSENREQNSKTDCSDQTLQADSLHKLLTSVHSQVKVLEPSVIAMAVILCGILFSLSVQMFLSCKIIRNLDNKRAPRSIQLSGSQSKMSDHNKSGQLEEVPFYASV